MRIVLSNFTIIHCFSLRLYRWAGPEGPGRLLETHSNAFLKSLLDRNLMILGTRTGELKKLPGVSTTEGLNSGSHCRTRRGTAGRSSGCAASWHAWTRPWRRSARSTSWSWRRSTRATCSSSTRRYWRRCVTLKARMCPRGPRPSPRYACSCCVRAKDRWDGFGRKAKILFGWLDPKNKNYTLGSC